MGVEELSVAEIKKYTVKQLKDVLKEAGLDLSGLKADLQQRLLEVRDSRWERDTKGTRCICTPAAAGNGDAMARSGTVLRSMEERKGRRKEKKASGRQRRRVV